MAEFVQIVTSFPTVLFTLGMGLVSLYWLFTIVGALDIEALDGLTGDLDLDADLDLDVDVDADIDVDADADADVAGGAAGAWVWFANSIRLGRVPVAVTISLVALWGWVTAFLLTWVSLRVGGIPVAVTMVGSTIGALAGGMALTNVTTRPLESWFVTHDARSNHTLVGELCRVTTGRVDGQFGQAELTVDTDHLTISIRCDVPGATLARGDEALIVQFDTRREAFVVEPLAVALTEQQRQRAARPVPAATPTTES